MTSIDEVCCIPPYVFPHFTSSFLQSPPVKTSFLVNFFTYYHCYTTKFRIQKYYYK